MRPIDADLRTDDVVVDLRIPEAVTEDAAGSLDEEFVFQLQEPHAGRELDSVVLVLLHLVDVA